MKVHEQKDSSRTRANNFTKIDTTRKRTPDVCAQVLDCERHSVTIVEYHSIVSSKTGHDDKDHSPGLLARK
jgi:hypothetical protein